MTERETTAGRAARVATWSKLADRDPAEALQKFSAWADTEKDAVFVDEDDVAAWEQEHPQGYGRDGYRGLYADKHGGPEEPCTAHIRQLAADGLEQPGHHGAVSAMGAPVTGLPRHARLPHEQLPGRHRDAATAPARAPGAAGGRCAPADTASSPTSAHATSRPGSGRSRT